MISLTSFQAPMRTRIFAATAGIILLVIIALSMRWIFINDDDGPRQTMATVARGDIENLVTATGILQPRDYVDVGAQVSGQLKKLHVDVGSEVKAGDLLAEIDATVYAAKVDATRALLRNQKAQLLDRQAQRKLAVISLKRQRNLLKEDATTTESVEVAEANVQSAKAQFNALQAQIEQTESTLRVEDANLDYARIYAPISGTVVSITSRQGQTLNTNQMAPTIMRIADLSVMTVQTQVSEADIGKLKPDMPVYFTTLGSQGRRWYSQLEQIQPTPELLNNVVLYNALFDVPNEQRLLMTQMSAQVFFIQSHAKNVLVVPLSALTFIQPTKKDKKPISEPLVKPTSTDGSASSTTFATIKVQKDNGQIEERKVKVGITNRVQAEIVDGLDEGDKIVIGSVMESNSSRPAPAGGWGGGGMGRR